MPEPEVAQDSSTDEIINDPIVADILNKDHHNANEKIYNALYGKSSEYITARKARIAKPCSMVLIKSNQIRMLTIR